MLCTTEYVTRSAPLAVFSERFLYKRRGCPVLSSWLSHPSLLLPWPQVTCDRCGNRSSKPHESYGLVLPLPHPGEAIGAKTEDARSRIGSRHRGKDAVVEAESEPAEAIDLLSCFQRMMRPEELDGANSYWCTRSPQAAHRTNVHAKPYFRRFRNLDPQPAFTLNPKFTLILAAP